MNKYEKIIQTETQTYRGAVRQTDMFRFIHTTNQTINMIQPKRVLCVRLRDRRSVDRTNLVLRLFDSHSGTDGIHTTDEVSIGQTWC